MTNIAGTKLAVAGMGRSGIGIALAAVRRGAVPTVYDQQSADTEERLLALEKLESHGVQAVTGWHGRLDPAEFDVLVASPGFRREHPAIRDALQGGKAVVSEVEFAFWIARAPIVAITGTNGKSTTTVLAWQLLKAAGTDAVLCGNLSGSGYPELTLTEAADVSEPGHALVAEVSSYQLEWVKRFRPRVATITNVTPDHLDRHPSFEDYFETKLRIFGAMGSGDVLVHNADEASLPMSRLEKRLPDGLVVVQFGAGRAIHPTDSGIAADCLEVDLSGTALDHVHGRTNACAAWALARSFVGSIDSAQAGAMVRALREFRGLAHRMEWVGEKAGVAVINNSMCTNPAAVVASCEGLGRRQLLLLGGHTKSLDFSPVRELLSRSSHRAAVFGPEAEALLAQLGGDGVAVESLEAAFEWAVRHAESGDAIVLSPGCASAFPYSNFRERGEAFKQLAKEWMEK